MKIFTIILLLVVAVIAGVFLRMSWENYKIEGIPLTRYWHNTLPCTVTQPFYLGVFLFLMCIFILITTF